MDDQRIRAYFELISQLVQCPSGDEEKILQANRELVDQGLVQTMSHIGLEEDLANVLKNLEIVELIRAQLDIAPESK